MKKLLTCLLPLLAVFLVSCADNGDNNSTAETESETEPVWLLFVTGPGSYDAAAKTVTLESADESRYFTDRPDHVSYEVSSLPAIASFVEPMLEEGNPPNATFVVGDLNDHVSFVAEIVSVTVGTDQVTLSLKETVDMHGDEQTLPNRSYSNALVTSTIDTNFILGLAEDAWHKLQTKAETLLNQEKETIARVACQITTEAILNQLRLVNTTSVNDLKGACDALAKLGFRIANGDETVLGTLDTVVQIVKDNPQVFPKASLVLNTKI